MCLMLYVATHGDQPLRSSPTLRVEEIEGSGVAVRQWFSLPTVRFIGAHTGCSCGFPHIVMADEPAEYFDGMFGDGEDRAADLASLRSLLALLREHVGTAGEVQLYPVWNGNEASAPKGTIDLALDTIDAGTFVFTEQFFYRVAAGPK